MPLAREAAPCMPCSSQSVTFWLMNETSSRISFPLVFICAVSDATAAVMWLWSSKPNLPWGDSWVGDAGGVFWMVYLGFSQFSGTEAGYIDSGLGRLETKTRTHTHTELN